MGRLKFAMLGTGFWARYQLAGWRELDGVECVALYNRTLSKAKALAREFHVSSTYDDPEELLHKEKLDFVDIVTDVDHHAVLVKMAAAHKLPVICQKPMAPTMTIAEEMVQACRSVGVPLLINENWRWQTPLRRLKAILQCGEIGTPFRARLDMISSFPIFQNQPFLRDLEQFILMDLGSHILDVARFLFGEAETLYCQTRRVHPDIKNHRAGGYGIRRESTGMRMFSADFGVCRRRQRIHRDSSGLLDQSHECRRYHRRTLSSPDLFLGPSCLPGGSLQHRFLPGQSAGGIEWRISRDHGRGQPEDGTTGLCVL